MLDSALDFLRREVTNVNEPRGGKEGNVYENVAKSANLSNLAANCNGTRPSALQSP